MSRNLHFTDCEAPMSRSDSDEERISKSSGEDVNSYLRLPQTQSKSSNSINGDGIICEPVATVLERSETLPHSNIQTTRANDTASYLPDICLQVSGIESSDNGIRTCSRDGEDVVLNSNILFNLKRRPQSAQPTSRSSMSRQSPSEGNMESGTPPLGAIFNRLRPATASAIRCMENSVLRSRLDQALCESEIQDPSSDFTRCSKNLPSAISCHLQTVDSPIIDPLYSMSLSTDQFNHSNRNIMIGSSTLLMSDEPQPDASDVQRWDKIRGSRTSKYGKSPVNVSASPKRITKHRSGDRKMIKTKNNSFDMENDKNVISRFSNDGCVERVKSKIFVSSSSPLGVVRQEVTTCPASPVDPPFASYITTEYVTPLGVCGEEWRSLQMALKGCALDIQHTDLRDLLAGSTGHAEDVAVGYLCVLFNVEPNMKNARSTVLRGTAPLLRFLREADPATVPPPLLLEASSYWGQRKASILSGKEHEESQSSVGKLCRWIQYFDTMSQLLKTARDSGSDSGKMAEIQVQTIHPASPRLCEAVYEGTIDGSIVVEDTGEGWIEEIDGVWRGNERGEGNEGGERDLSERDLLSKHLPSVITSSHRAPSFKASHVERQSILDDTNDYCDNVLRDSRRNSGRDRERDRDRDSQRSSDLKPISEKDRMYATKMKLFSMYQPEKKRKSSKIANAGTRNLDRRKSQNSVARLSSGSGDVLDYFREMEFDETAGFDILLEAEVPFLDGDRDGDGDRYKGNRQSPSCTGIISLGYGRTTGRESGRGRDSCRSHVNSFKDDGIDLESVLGPDQGLGQGQGRVQKEPTFIKSEGLYGRNHRYGSITVCDSTEQQRYFDSDTDTEAFHRLQGQSPLVQGRRGRNSLHSAYGPSKHDVTRTTAWSQIAHPAVRTDITSRYAISATMPARLIDRQGRGAKQTVSPIQKRHMHVGAAGAADNLDYYKSARKRFTSTEKALKKIIAGSTAIHSSRVKSALYPQKTRFRTLSSYGLFFEHVWCPSGEESNGEGYDEGAGADTGKGGSGGGGEYCAAPDRAKVLSESVIVTETKAPALPIIPEVKLVRMSSLTLNKLSRPKGSRTLPLGTGTGTVNPIPDPPRNLPVGSGRASRTRVPSLTVGPVETVPVVDSAPLVGVSEVVAEAVSEVVSKAVSEVVSEVASKAVAEVVSKVVSEVMSKAVSEVVSRIMSEGTVTMTNADDAERSVVQETFTDGADDDNTSPEAEEEDGEEYYADDTEIEIETMAETLVETVTQTGREAETVIDEAVVFTTPSNSEGTENTVGVAMAENSVEAANIEETESILTAEGYDDAIDEDVDLDAHSQIAVIEKDDYDNDFEDEVDEFVGDEEGADIVADAEGQGQEEGDAVVEREGDAVVEEEGDAVVEEEGDTVVEEEGDAVVEGEGEGEGEAEEGYEMDSSQTMSITGETLTEDTTSYRAFTERQCSDTDSYSYPCDKSETDSTSNRTGHSNDIPGGKDGSMNDVTIPYSVENHRAEADLTESSVCKTADSTPYPCAVYADIFQSAFEDMGAGAGEVEANISLGNPSQAA